MSITKQCKLGTRQGRESRLDGKKALSPLASHLVPDMIRLCADAALARSEDPKMFFTQPTKVVLREQKE
jgi:hypothetical protein